VPDQETAVPTAESVTLRLSPRQGLEALSLPALSALVLAVAAVAHVGTGPVDYRMGACWILVTAAVLMLLWIWPTRVRRGLAVTLTPEGIRGIAPWPEVTGLRVLWWPFGQYLRVHRTPGRAVTLPAPQGSWWRRDAAFDRDVMLVHEYAVRHGAQVAAPARRRPLLPALAVGLALAGVLAVTGAQVADRHVIWPWTPQAVAFPTLVCEALHDIGINQIWPPEQRELDSEFSTDDSSSTFSGCRFTVASGHYRDSRFGSLMVTVVREHGDFVTSPVGSAARAYRSDRARTMGPRTLPGLGDEAFVGRWATMTRAEGRRADVVIQVQLRSDNRAPEEETARRILAGLLDRVRTG
jgi:hypothetical protein